MRFRRFKQDSSTGTAGSGSAINRADRDTGAFRAESGSGSAFCRADRDTGAALIGLDLGTSALKAVGLCGDKIFARASSAVRYNADGPRLEFDAEEHYVQTASLIKEIWGRKPDGAACAGICISSASGNTLLTDASGKPLIPVISWRDARQTHETERLFGAGGTEQVYRLTGWPYSGSFPLAHLSWLACHRRELLKNAGMVCLSADYINFRLTGNWAIDNSTATTFYLQDQLNGRWHEPFLKALDLSRDRLPALMRTGEAAGVLTGEASTVTGLPAGTPVILGSFDHPSAARGAGVLEPGEMMLSCGTSWVCFYPHKDRDAILANGLLCDPFLAPDGPYAGMRALTNISAKIDAVLEYIFADSHGTDGSAGSAGKNGGDNEVGDNSGEEERGDNGGGKAEIYAEFDKLARGAEPGSCGLIINPMDVAGCADTGCATGGLAEIVRKYRKENICRALMEGAGYLLRAETETLCNRGFPADRITMVGGPSLTDPWPQIICDILGRPIKTVNGAYAGAVGAALTAGIAAGVYGGYAEAAKRVAGDVRTREPDGGHTAVYKDGYEKFQNLFAK